MSDWFKSQFDHEGRLGHAIYPSKLDHLISTIQAEVRDLRREVMELRELCMSRLRVPPNNEFEVEEDTTPEATPSGLVAWAELKAKEKARPVSREGHLPDCIGGYSCEASCVGLCMHGYESKLCTKCRENRGVYLETD